MNRQLKSAKKATKQPKAVAKKVVKRKVATKKVMTKRKSATTTRKVTTPVQTQLSLFSTASRAATAQRFAPTALAVAHRVAANSSTTTTAATIATTTTTPFTTSFASLSTQSFRAIKATHPLAMAAPMQFQSQTGLPSHITAQISNVSFVPKAVLKQSKRGFLGNLGSMFGGKKAAAADGPQHGLGSMMEMMQMMQMMQKITNMVKNGQPSDAEYNEIIQFIDQLRAKQGGTLPPEIDGLLEKIKTRQPINQDEVMGILGITPAEAAEIREVTMGVKNGTVNQMAYMMKVAEIFQKAQGRKQAAAPADAAQIKQ